MRSLFSRLSDFYASVPVEKWYLLALGVIGTLRLVNLGFHDMQAWDEAVYAVRSMGILRYGLWIDQTPVSIDGLYSSFHPPLHIWLTAAAQSVFGLNEFAGRFFSAVMGAGTLFVIYATGRVLDRPKTGFLAALLFGLSPFVTFYSRQGQLDTTMTFFIALGMLYVVKMIASDNSRKYWLMAGIALGLGLLSRSFVAMGFVIAFLIWIFASGSTSRRRYIYPFLKMTGIGIAIVLPWYAYMTFEHGAGNLLFFIASADLWDRIAVGFEGNVKPLGPLSQVNQLIVVVPIALAWGVAGIYRAIRERSPGWLFVALSFLLFFVVFSLVRSKLAVYLLPALVPFTLLAGREIIRAVDTAANRRSMALLIGLTFLSVLWALRQEWRDAVREFLQGVLSLDIGVNIVAPPLLTLLLALILSGTIFWILIRHVAEKSLRRYLIPALLVPAFAVTLLQILYVDRFRHVDGAHALASYVNEIKAAKLVVAGYERNPQLTYYFNGADIGWQSEVEIRRIIPPNDSLQFRIWLTGEMQTETSDAVLIIEKDKFIRYLTIDALRIAPENYALAFESRRYAVFVYVPFVNLVQEMGGERSSRSMRWRL